MYIYNTNKHDSIINNNNDNNILQAAKFTESDGQFYTGDKDTIL